MLKKMTYGIMLSKTDALKQWQLDVVNELQNTGLVELKLLIVNQAPQSGLKLPSRYQALKRIPFRLYNKVCHKRTRTQSEVALPLAYAQCKKLTITKVKKRGISEYFQGADIDAVNSEKLDFILRFSFGILRGNVLEAARYGVWSYHHDDERVYRGSPPCFWPLYEQNPTSGAILQRLTNTLDKGIILKRGVFRTQKGYARNIDHVYGNCTGWPAQIVKKLAVSEDFESISMASDSKAAIYKPPSPWRMARYFYNQFSASINGAIKRVFSYELWKIGVFEDTTFADLVKGTESLDRLTIIESGESGHYYADPFGYTENNKIQLLFENYDYTQGIGYLSKISLDGLKAEKKPQLYIREEHHLSYPSVVINDGHRYCIPEAGECGQVFAYDLDDPKIEPRLVFDKPVIDPTVLYYNDCWWLFGGSPGNGQEHLEIWYSRNGLFGDWQPHALNPVVSDITLARQGGAFVKVDETLYRVSQDCGKEYGYGIVLSKVEFLSTTNFSEKIVRRIKPTEFSADFVGVHTLNVIGEHIVIDGKIRLYGLNAMKIRAMNFLRSRFRKLAKKRL